MSYNISRVERYSVFTWSTTTGLISVTGNLTVLLAAVVFRALKLDKVSLVLISNLAIADLITGATAILPTIGTSLAGRWVFGDFLCVATNYLESISTATSIGLLCSINVAKLTSLLCPLRALTRTRKCGYVVATSIWLLSLFTVVPYLMVGVNVSYSPVMMRCHKGSVEALDTWLKPILSASLVFGPFLLINIATVWLLYFVHTARGLQKQSVVMVILISMIFMISFLPYGLIMLKVIPGNLLWFVKVAIYTPFLNCTCNPLVYFFTISSFRDFVLMSLRMKKKARASPVFFRHSSMYSHTGGGDQVVMNANLGNLRKSNELTSSTEKFFRAT